MRLFEPSPPVQHLRAYLARERFFVGGLSILTGLLVGHFAVLQYHAQCTAICLDDPGNQPAPQAYRVAMPAIEHFFTRLLHIQGAYVLGLVDVLCITLAVYILYYLAIASLAPATAERVAVGALFFGLIQFPIGFISHWIRPETSPTVLFVAVFAYCLTKTHKSWVWTAVLMVVTLAQTLVRADVPFVMGIALTVLGGTGALTEWGSRSANLMRGLAVLLMAGGLQLYLQFWLFPHRPYMTGSPFMVYMNITPHYFSVFVLAMLPPAFIAWLYTLRRTTLMAVDRLALLASILYLPAWFAVGIVIEVRIFVPMLLLLDVVAARVSISYLLGDQAGDAFNRRITEQRSDEAISESVR